MLLTPGVEGWWNERSLEGTESVQPVTLRSNHAVRSSRTTLRLGIDFVHVEVAELNDEFWQGVDETPFPPMVRQAWLANGMRIGQWVGPASPLGPTPTSREQSLDPSMALLVGAGVAGTHRNGHETVALQASRRHELPIGQPLEGRSSILVRERGELIGRHLESPQYVLAMLGQTGPGEGQATLAIHPEIHFGAAQQRFISSDTAVRIDTGRQRWELSPMHFIWTAAEQQTLIIAPATDPGATPPTFGLGNQILRDRGQVDEVKTMVVLLRWERIPSQASSL